MITLKLSEVPTDQAFQRLQTLSLPYFWTPTRETVLSPADLPEEGQHHARAPGTPRR